jgi:hypothetical protein
MSVRNTMISAIHISGAVDMAAEAAECEGGTSPSEVAG